MSVHPVEADKGRYAVIFVSKRSGSEAEYAEMNTELGNMAREIPGFVDEIALRNDQGSGISVSFWENEAAIEEWRQHARHRLAKQMGRDLWYDWYAVYICEIEFAHRFIKNL